MKNYILAFKKIFDFRGEATLSEFWSFFIINIIVSSVVIIVLKKLDFPIVIYIYRIITILVLTSIGFRRLRNAGYSGWLFFIPLVNLIFASLPGKEKI